jgi:uncharacterized protein YkwD
MTFRFLPTALALTLALTIGTDVEAGPLRRRAQQSYQPSYQPSNQPSYQPVPESYPVATPSAMPAGEYVTNYPPVATAGFQGVSAEPANSSAGVGDGLDEVNAKRAARGLRPLIRDEGLTQAASACAAFRAENGLFGHTSNDFAFVPPGSSASSAGCAAYPASYGWMSCCIYDGYTYGGAAWVTGRDGRRYMHLFVR